MGIKRLTNPTDQSPPPEPKLIHASPLARVLAVLLASILLAAIGAAAIVGLITFIVFFLVLMPVLLVLLVAAFVFGRGRFKIYVYRRFSTTQRRTESQPGQSRNPDARI